MPSFGSGKLKVIIRLISPVIAIAALCLAMSELDTLKKSSELAATQALMDTYYRALNRYVDAQRQMQNTLVEITPEKIGIEMRMRKPQELSVSPEQAMKDSQMKSHLELKETYSKVVVDRALSDFVAVVANMCKQRENGLLGATAVAFLLDVVNRDMSDLQESFKLEELITEGKGDAQESDTDKRANIPKGCFRKS